MKDIIYRTYQGHGSSVEEPLYDLECDLGCCCVVLWDMGPEDDRDDVEVQERKR